MDLVSFDTNFRNVDINIKKYILVVSIFMFILFVLLLFNNSIEDYIIIKSSVNNKKIEFIVDIDNLDIINNKNKIIIEGNTFTYRIDKIDDYIYEDKLYKKITIQVDDIDEKYLINNNIIKMKIVTNKMTIINYLIKSIKGDV